MVHYIKANDIIYGSLYYFLDKVTMFTLIKKLTWIY